ncbi:MAG: hypothetical protein K0S08_2020 [Gammaproteobacteria bacterium]|jgi:hypothetical protein|nr:hypothetical protein [Gammaproteobacteria bacterium]
MRYFLLLLTLFIVSASADDAPPTNPATQSTGTSTSNTAGNISPSASVTLSPSSQGITQIKNFFDGATYDNLVNPTSGVTQLALPER